MGRNSRAFSIDGEDPRTKSEALDGKWDVNAETGCWEWNKHRTGKQYGTLTYQGRKWMAHRLSYAAFKGELIDGLIICHECDNPCCINPAHLTQADYAYNNRAKGRIARLKATMLEKYPKTDAELADIEYHTQRLKRGERLPRTAEHQSKLVESWKATWALRGPRKHSDATKAKMSASHQGRKHSPETIEKLKLAAAAREAAKRSQRDNPVV